MRHLAIIIVVLLIAGALPALAQDSPRITGNNAGQLTVITTLGWGSVSDMAWSQDGQTVAVVGFAGLHLHDIDALNRPRLLTPLDDPMPITYSVAFSPDNAWIAAGRFDGTVELWDTATETLLGSIPSDNGPAYSVAFSPDGFWMTVGYWDGTVRLWDLRRGAEGTYNWEAHSEPVEQLAFSPDSTLLVTGTGVLGHEWQPGEQEIGLRVWDVATQTQVTEIMLEYGAIAEIAFSPEGDHLAYAVWDQPAVRLWDMAEHTVIASASGPEGELASCIGFNPAGDTAIVCSTLGPVWLADAESLTRHTTLTGHQGQVWRAAFSPDGTRIASLGSEDGALRLWDATTYENLGTVYGYAKPAEDLALNQDGSQILAAIREGTWLWTPATGTGERLPLPRNSGPLAFSEDGRLVVIADGDATVHVWDAATGRTTAELTANDVLQTDDPYIRVAGLALSERGDRLAVVYSNDVVAVWDLDAQAEAARFEGLVHTRHSQSAELRFSADGRLLLVGGWHYDHETESFDDARHMAQVWNIATGQAHTVDCTPYSARVQVAFTPEDTPLAVCVLPDEMVIYNVHTESAIQTIEHESVPYVTSVAFSPDAALLAAGTSQDGVIRFFDVTGGAYRAGVSGGIGTVETLAFSGDGTRLVTSSTGGQLRVLAVP